MKNAAAAFCRTANRANVEFFHFPIEKLRFAVGGGAFGTKAAGVVAILQSSLVVARLFFPNADEFNLDAATDGDLRESRAFALQVFPRPGVEVVSPSEIMAAVIDAVAEMKKIKRSYNVPHKSLTSRFNFPKMPINIVKNEKPNNSFPDWKSCPATRLTIEIKSLSLNFLLLLMSLLFEKKEKPLFPDWKSGFGLMGTEREKDNSDKRQKWRFIRQNKQSPGTNHPGRLFIQQ